MSKAEVRRKPLLLSFFIPPQFFLSLVIREIIVSTPICFKKIFVLLLNLGLAKP